MTDAIFDYRVLASLVKVSAFLLWCLETVLVEVCDWDTINSIVTRVHDSSKHKIGGDRDVTFNFEDLLR